MGPKEVFFFLIFSARGDLVKVSWKSDAQKCQNQLTLPYFDQLSERHQLLWPFCQNVIVQEVVTFISEWQVYYGSMTNSNYLYFWRSILSSWICFEKEQTSHRKAFLAGKEIDCATIAFWFDLFSCEQLSDGLLSTQSSISSDKNGWIHFVFLQPIFGLLSNVDR